RRTTRWSGWPAPSPRNCLPVERPYSRRTCVIRRRTTRTGRPGEPRALHGEGGAVVVEERPQHVAFAAERLRPVSPRRGDLLQIPARDGQFGDPLRRHELLTEPFLAEPGPDGPGLDLEPLDDAVQVVVEGRVRRVVLVQVGRRERALHVRRAL